MRLQFRKNYWFFGVLLVLLNSFCFSQRVLSKETNAQHGAFSALGCVTWWSHDAVGYHPAMYLLLENVSGGPVTGEEIPFQGRFTDVRSGYVTVAREYKRSPIHSHERFVLLLRAPQSFELPIDSGSWPAMECKAMCRLPNGDIEELFITHLARITMTDEDAQAQLIAQAGRGLLLAQNDNVSKKLPRLEIEEVTDTGSNAPIKNVPLDTVTMPVTTKAAGRNKNVVSGVQEPHEQTNLPKKIPAVGNDFYVFDQLYGNAKEFEPANGDGNLTWAHYKSSGLVKDVFVGSRNSNKADIVMMAISANSRFKEKDILSLSKQLAGCSKRQIITPFTHSVRYLPSGRSEVMTTVIRECRILSFKAHSADEQEDEIVIAASRLPGEVEATISNYSKHVSFLRDLFGVN